MADRPFICEPRAVPRLLATAAQLLKHLDAQMPTLHLKTNLSFCPWICPTAKCVVNRSNLELALCALMSERDLSLSFCSILPPPTTALHLRTLWKCPLFRVSVTDGYLQQRGFKTLVAEKRR